MKVVFSDQAWDDYQPGSANDLKSLEGLNGLIEESRRIPFGGTGKPEALRGDLQGWWSRRLSREHRLAYRVEGKGAEQRHRPAPFQC